MPNVKQKRTKTSSKNSKPFDRSKAFMFGFIIGLVGIVVTLTVVQAEGQNANALYGTSTTQ